MADLNQNDSGFTTLYKYINETSDQFRISLFYKIFQQVCVEVSHIHDSGFIHSGINTDTLLINLGTQTVKLISSSEPNNSIYQSPELLDKNDNIYSKYFVFGTHNDIWSIGMTMLEFIVGRQYKSLVETHENQISNFLSKDNIFPVVDFINSKGYNLENHGMNKIINIIENMLVKDIDERYNLNTCYKSLSGKDLPLTNKNILKKNSKHDFLSRKGLHTPLKIYNNIRKNKKCPVLKPKSKKPKSKKPSLSSLSLSSLSLSSLSLSSLSLSSLSLSCPSSPHLSVTCKCKRNLMDKFSQDDKEEKTFKKTIREIREAEFEDKKNDDNEKDECLKEQYEREYDDKFFDQRDDDDIYDDDERDNLSFHL
jgi:serine/threonine protein kinase